MGIKVCENQVAGPFWGPEGGYNRGNVWYLKKCTPRKPMARMH